MRSRLRDATTDAWRRLRGGELRPGRAALSVAVGLAIGVTPLYGGHIFLVLAVCVPLRLDAPLSYLAANISIPIVAPFLTMAELEIGARLLTGHALPMDLAAVKAHGVRSLFKELVLGTLVFAPTLAALGGMATFVCVRAWQKRDVPEVPDEFTAAVDRVARRYAPGGRASYHYVRGKLAGDPVCKRIGELGAASPLGDVIDAGCGRGQLAVLLLEQGVARAVRGIDWDAKKIAVAQGASLGLPASFDVGDLRTPPPEGDTVLLIDVLHYLTSDEQDEVLRNAARAAKRSVIIRELDPDRGWRSIVTKVQEAVTTGVGYNRGARVHVRPISAMQRVLEAEGFTTEVSPCWGSMPLSNVLVVARRV